MPPPPLAALSAADRAVLDRWIAGGAPGGTAACAHAPTASAPPASTAPGQSPAPPPSDVTTPGLSCKADVAMRPATPWAMPQDTDDVYVCYGFDVSTADKRHLVAIAPRIQNPAIVHHLVLFQTPAAGSAVPAPCATAGGGPGARIVYAWAPGGGPFELPPEAGIPQQGTTHYVVQVHYNNIRHLPGQSDASGFDFCTTDQLRPNDADSMVFGAEDFTVPPRGSLDETCDWTVPAGLHDVHVFAAMPHMHQIGTSIATTVRTGDAGAPRDLGAQPHWDFANQPYLPVSQTLRPGDVVSTRCVWTNVTDHPVRFGEFTEDEMCFSFAMYYPRITAPRWAYYVPTVMARCRTN
jgi:hypothetical protein